MRISTITRWRSMAVTAIVAALLTGCLEKDERHIWYLDAASGSITWTAFEHDVRSDEKDAAKRLSEEAEYGRKVRTEAHGAARGFRALGGSKVRTLIVRGEPPFSVVTDTGFASIDELGRRLLAHFGAVGTSVLERDGESLVWTLKARVPQETPDPPRDEDADSLFIGLFESLRVVLPTGHFETAVGFTLDNQGRVATINPDHFEGSDDRNTEVTLSLRWTQPKP